MIRFVLAIVAMVLLTQSPSLAQCPHCGGNHGVVGAVVTNTNTAIAQSRVAILARTHGISGRLAHPPGGFSMAGARFEGVGFSTVSAADALRHCCFYGRKPLIASATARNSRGWVALALYR